MNPSPSFCAFCGKPLTANAAYCEYCGKPVGKAPADAPAQSPRSSRAASSKKILAILVPSLAVVCLGGVALLVVFGIVTYGLTANQRAAQKEPGHPVVSTAAATLNVPALIMPTMPDFEEPTPTDAQGALAKSFVSIDFDPSTCKQDTIGSYNFRGTVTNTSSEYSLANIVLGGKLIDANENIVQWGIGSPDAVVLRPGQTVDFWFWIDWTKLVGFRCEAYAISAEIADQ